MFCSCLLCHAIAPTFYFETVYRFFYSAKFLRICMHDRFQPNFQKPLWTFGFYRAKIFNFCLWEAGGSKNTQKHGKFRHRGSVFWKKKFKIKLNKSERHQVTKSLSVIEFELLRLLVRSHLTCMTYIIIGKLGDIGHLWNILNILHKYRVSKDSKYSADLFWIEFDVHSRDSFFFKLIVICQCI